MNAFEEYLQKCSRQTLLNLMLTKYVQLTMIDDAAFRCGVLEDYIIEIDDWFGTTCYAFSEKGKDAITLWTNVDTL